MNTTTEAIICPICHRQTCECLLRDRQFLARQVGKLMRGGDGDLATGNGGLGAKNDKTKATPAGIGDDLCDSDSDGTIIAMQPSVDLRKLPYAAGTADHLVIDPPHIHDTGIPRYNSRRTIRAMSHDDIITQLYGGGLEEARRVLRRGGLAWVSAGTWSRPRPRCSIISRRCRATPS
jgi:hypothetical protein